jgi:4-hydroxyphenylpyruvate dioxygenase-like putative hemolysin
MDQQTADLLTKVAGPVATVLASLTAAGVAIAFGISQSPNAKRQISDGESNIRGGGVDQTLDYRIAARAEALAKIVKAMEKAGITFLPANAQGSGIRGKVG